ncbi:hypothetical protein JG688_00005669 [Phytophthora aleatoria]|uniref:Uncharacterized protein n=1 Tax=Phytophthora aleatoria TaxID=2496075 RepID=A0A8J5IPG1_9STRA|nr:hypothetical protein JG688_00005669 [Phytophthora aleatoria]
MKTQPVPADFKLVLATDGDQSLLCEEVVVEERNERVTTVMNALAAQEEIDLSRTGWCTAAKCAGTSTTSRAFACDETDIRFCD